MSTYPAPRYVDVDLFVSLISPVPPQGADISPKCRLIQTYYGLRSTYSKQEEFQPFYRGGGIDLRCI